MEEGIHSVHAEAEADTSYSARAGLHCPPAPSPGITRRKTDSSAHRRQQARREAVKSTPQCDAAEARQTLTGSRSVVVIILSGSGGQAHVSTTRNLQSHRPTRARSGPPSSRLTPIAMTPTACATGGSRTFLGSCGEPQRFPTSLIANPNLFPTGSAKTTKIAILIHLTGQLPATYTLDSGETVAQSHAATALKHHFPPPGYFGGKMAGAFAEFYLASRVALAPLADGTC
ncbi:hypothetical protein DFH27DRAFT_615568 [Peziza echinospora]|nr:hypothetical protein DFH27DRAFT_615568 [Peziza echinospora]